MNVYEQFMSASSDTRLVNVDRIWLAVYYMVSRSHLGFGMAHQLTIGSGAV
jgi:hypothetical protein